MRIKCEYPESEYTKVCSVEHDINREVAYIRSYDRVTYLSFYAPTKVGNKNTTLFTLWDYEVNTK